MIKTFLAASTAAICLLIIAKSSYGQSPAKDFKQKNFVFHNLPLKDALSEIAAYYKVTISNSQHVVGERITGVIEKTVSVDGMVAMVTYTEGGNAFLRYQKGVIYVSRAGIVKDFDPRSECQCSYLLLAP